jgi:TrpR-related protein YerC/YecD
MAYKFLNIWETDEAAQLAHVLANVNRLEDMQAVLRDLLTDKEIATLARRLESAKQLASGVAYQDVIRNTGMSSRTLTKVNQKLTSGSFGYPLALRPLGLVISMKRSGNSDRNRRAVYERVRRGGMGGRR